jgi:hypothetical protein
MARSYRQTPIFGITTAKSEKRDKRLANRRHRRALRQAVLRGAEVMPLLREVSNVWCFEKDGKGYWRDATWKDMRK